MNELASPLYDWLVSARPASLTVLEREINILMATLRACRTPAGRKAMEERLRPLLEKRKDLLASQPGRRAA